MKPLGIFYMIFLTCIGTLLKLIKNLEKIALTVTKKLNEVVHTPAKVLADQDVNKDVWKLVPGKHNLTSPMSPYS
ncbi:hypothetical protein QJS10_CPA07g00798 [Acorus calamus]|uniref:Uncharacterized protein n=1 Tax=Acorus calamus TaxID=4465 RepID=A0AAV9EIN4_ACOCL|nr:hypothetical protein QJS10_CPA07g00798 [Acorus calamus]